MKSKDEDQMKVWMRLKSKIRKKIEISTQRLKCNS